MLLNIQKKVHDLQNIEIEQGIILVLLRLDATGYEGSTPIKTACFNKIAG